MSSNVWKSKYDDPAMIARIVASLQKPTWYNVIRSVSTEMKTLYDKMGKCVDEKEAVYRKTWRFPSTVRIATKTSTGLMKRKFTTFVDEDVRHVKTLHVLVANGPHVDIRGVRFNDGELSFDPKLFYTAPVKTMAIIIGLFDGMAIHDFQAYDLEDPDSVTGYHRWPEGMMHFIREVYSAYTDDIPPIIVARRHATTTLRRAMKHTIAARQQKRKNIGNELRAMPRLGSFPGGVNFQRAEKQWNAYQSSLRKRKR